MLHVGKDVDGLLNPHPLQHVVQGDEGACPAHPSTAVHQQVGVADVWMGLSDLFDEVDEGCGIAGHSMVRPGQVVVLGHLQRGCVWLSGLHGILQSRE